MLDVVCVCVRACVRACVYIIKLMVAIQTQAATVVTITIKW